MKSKLILFVSILLLFLQSRPVLAADDPCQTWGIETFNNCWGGYHVTIDGKLLTGTYTEGTVFTWNFGDGSPTQTTTSNQPAMVGHVYAGSGPYTISLTWQAPSCSPVTVYKTFVPEILKLNFHVSDYSVLSSVYGARNSDSFNVWNE